MSTRSTTGSTTGAEHSAEGDSTTVSVPLDGTGAGRVSFWAVDRAGNREETQRVALQWDNLEPVVTHTLNPQPTRAAGTTPT